ncbi:hypothetical protein RJ640_022810 [Escallonia rubra]|uniref:2Fe-2S ferredoxin-type domain-containing protein n=1 Tax=Escallonia rubra TaxID=112253 RepID=A0AA88UW26_9ASTE|nr:hypothetical protein RJ640_022810 [Escallonia rubra]
MKSATGVAGYRLKVTSFTIFDSVCSQYLTFFSPLASTPRRTCLHAVQNRFLLPQVALHLFLQRHEPFSTTAADKAQLEGNEETKKISVTFVDKDGDEKHINVPIGMSMLEAAHENDIELEGACEGSLACSTCHVIVMDIEYYNKLEDPTDEENDMLDLAFGLTETSRLGCQVIASPELDGIRLALPAATRNFAVDGYKPKPH